LVKKLLKYMKGYGKECALGPLFKMLEATFELLIPLVVASIIDTGIGNGDHGHIVNMCLVMVLLGVVGLACAVTAQYFAARAAVGFAAKVRRGLMHHVLHLSYTEIDRVGTSTIITRMTSDINQVQNGVNLTIRLLLRSPFVVFGAMVMAFTIDAQAALIFAGVIPVLCVVVFGIVLITMPAYRGVQEKLDGVTAATRENLAGVRVLRAFCKEEAETDEFREKTDGLYQKQLFAGRISNLLNPLTLVIINIAVILLIRVGAMKVELGVLTQGMVVALYNYMSQILVELIKMVNLIINITKAVACGNRIQAVLEIPLPAENAENKTLEGKVEFCNVTAKYAGAAEPSLENISFTALPGQTVGVIGSTGSGKSTLIQLIPKLYEAVSGQVLVDGVDVAFLSREMLCRQVGIVPQNAVLFKGTIRENLLWGNENATEEEMKDALKIAQALTFVEEKGLDAPVEEGGANFSGGQRQRLTIARALVGGPKILILDDSTSALDYVTDAALRKALKAMENAPTTFVVSQRAASVRHADKILVLEDGVLVGNGTHSELLDSCQVYREICQSQGTGEGCSNG